MSKHPLVTPAPAASAAVLALLCALNAGCSPKPADAGAASAATPATFRVTADQRARLSIVVAQPTTFQPTLEVTGNVAFNGDRSTQVLSPIAGPVVRLLVQPGARVAAGEALATVSSPDFATAIATHRKAEETVRNTQRILKLDEQLFQNDAIARTELDQARTDAAAAAADLEAAVQQLRSLGVADSTITAIHEGRQVKAIEGAIRSPIAGTVVEKLVNPGQLLQAGTTPTFTVADLSTMWVLASVYEADVGMVSAGQVAEIVTDASPKPIRGRVDYVAALVDPGTKATITRIVTDNPGAVLKRDMFVRVRIHSTHARAGILIPAAALLRDDDNLQFVFVARADGSFERRRVTVGYRVGDKHEIRTGLSAGDKVVADGALFLQFAESQ